jgi:hypothetical protein
MADLRLSVVSPAATMLTCTRALRSSLPRRVCAPTLSARLNHAGAGPSIDPNTGKTTHFGFRTIAETDKQGMVKQVFDSVASNYDVMNDAMSLGVHRLWKDEFVVALNPGKKGPMRCLDVAGGTGDIALRILDHAREKYADRETVVEISDINAEMLKEGYRRFKKTMYHNSMSASSHESPVLLTLPKPHRSSSRKQMHKSSKWSPTSTISTRSRLASVTLPTSLLPSERHTGYSSPEVHLRVLNSAELQTQY